MRQKPKRILWVTSSVLLIAFVVLWVSTSRAGYETARYVLDEKDGPFEIRTYEAHRVVTTSMKEGSQNGSFGRLFQYISGENEESQKIKMTTPVFMPATESGTTTEMQFVIPADVAKSGAPDPKNQSVRIKSFSGGKMAVIRFSGPGDAKQRREKLEKLRALIEAKGLTPIGDPIFAGYDPPWTPGPLRRNEVLLRLR